MYNFKNTKKMKKLVFGLLATLMFGNLSFGQTFEESVIIRLGERTTPKDAESGKSARTFTLVNFNKKFAVRDIELNCRAGKDAAILSAAYNDMDMTDINGDLLSYTFRDKEELTTDTSVYAKLMMVSKKSLNQIEAEAKEGTDEKDSVMVNWAFRLEEDGRLVNNFDGVQVEIPYTMEETND